MNNYLNQITMLALVACISIFSSCTNKIAKMNQADSASETTVIATNKEQQEYSLKPIWELDGFKEPECVFTFPGHKWIYVSNSNGPKPPGYISRISKDGKVDNYKWIEGLKRPTGMDEYNGYLYVVDLDEVHKIDIKKAEIIMTYKSETAKSLNDIAIQSNGKMYISDVNSGTIYTNDKDDKLVPWFKSELVTIPNAVMIGSDHLYVGNVGKSFEELQTGTFGRIAKVSYKDGTGEMVSPAEILGTWDGLDFFAEGIIASSPATNTVYYFYDGKANLVGKVEGQISDFGIDPSEGIIYAPLLSIGKVTAFQLNKKH